jgi:hypothetical protein
LLQTKAQVQFDKAVTVLSKLFLCLFSISNLAQFFLALIFQFYYLVNRKKATFSRLGVPFFTDFQRPTPNQRPKLLAKAILSFFVRQCKTGTERG